MSQMSPSEARTGATPEEVAAPAVRPLHRGRRSRDARCRRWQSWHTRVSQCLISLMPSIPFDISSSISSGPKDIAAAAAAAVAAAAAAAAVASAPAPAAAGAASVPGTGENLRFGQSSFASANAPNGRQV